MLDKLNSEICNKQAIFKSSSQKMINNQKKLNVIWSLVLHFQFNILSENVFITVNHQFVFS